MNGGAQDESTCGQCALRYISSSLLIEGVTLEEISHKSGTKFLQNLRQTLTNEIKKYHSKGLKSIKITSLSTHNRNSLVIEFVAIVNPKHHQQISSAIRRALLSINVSLVFLSICFSNQIFSFSSNKPLNTSTMNNKSNIIIIGTSEKYI